VASARSCLTIDPASNHHTSNEFLVLPVHSVKMDGTVRHSTHPANK
jgi:hypothetical protein